MIDRGLLVCLIDGLIADAKDGSLNLPSFERQTNVRKIWFELSFCIVSSQERVGRAAAAAQVLYDCFDELLASNDPRQTIRTAFDKAYVSLRFMNRKGEHLASAWAAFQRETATLVTIDEQFETPLAARDFLVSTFAGIGLKQASMLLRNIGWGNDLAIVDAHILRMSSLLFDRPAVEDRYTRLETDLRNFAISRDISLECLDVILWSCSRVLRSLSLREPTLV